MYFVQPELQKRKQKHNNGKRKQQYCQKSIGQCAHVLIVFIVTQQKANSKPFNKRSQQLEMLLRQMYKPPLQFSGLCVTLFLSYQFPEVFHMMLQCQ